MSETLSPAATVILVRDYNESLEVLLLQRNANASFLPEHWVFPGGAVDDDDLPGGCEIERARVAACREVNEEAGIMLKHTELVSFSHWTAPINFPRRFATWFFITDIDPEATIEIDNQEIQNYQWINPSQAIDLHYAGKLLIMPPTFKSLLELTSATNTEALISHNKNEPSFKYFPKIVQHENNKVFLYNNDSGYKNADASNTENLDRISMKNNIISYHKS